MMLQKKTRRFILTLEKYMHTDIDYIMTHASWVIGSQIISVLAAFTSTVILAHVLSVEVFGQYRFILSVLPILYIFTLPGINLSLIRSIARGAHTNLFSIAKIKIRWGLLGSIVSLGIALYYFSQGSELLFWAFVVSSLFIPFIETFSIYSSYYRGNRDFKTPAIYESTSRLIQAFLLIATALVTKNFVFILLALFISQLLTRLFFFLKTNRHIKILSIPESVTYKDDESDIITHGKKLSAISIFSIIAENIDKLLIWHFLGAKILAIYVIGLVFPKNIIALISAPLQSVAAPKISLKVWTQAEKIKYIKKVGILAGILILPVFLYIVTTTFLFQLLFRDYMESVYISQVLSIAILFIVPRNMVHEIFIAGRKNSLILFISTLHLLLIVVLLYTGMSMYGIIGIAYGYVLAEVSTTLVQMVVFLRSGIYNKNYENTFN